MRIAQQQGASWMVSPELALTGYHFAERIGTEWLHVNDPWLFRFQELCKELAVTLFLGHARRLPTGVCHNAVVVIDPQGRNLGEHYKINTIPISEAWSVPGGNPRPLDIGGVAVGVLVCADAWSKGPAAQLRRSGARVLVSPANWAPGMHGPGTTWEDRSRETRLPVWVANGTGLDGGLDLRGAHTVVCVDGKTALCHISSEPAVVIVSCDARFPPLNSRTVTL